jgi:enoyl-CoA hydratase/carnithine racemase
VKSCLLIERSDNLILVRLCSPDGTNRLSRVCVLALTEAVRELSQQNKPLVLTGNRNYFSVGADLNEIAALGGAEAYEFSRMGQALMHAIASFPAPVWAAVEGHCMGGGLDLALACRGRIAGPHAVFGHRGAALGLITGWGGTQRLPRLVGKAKALQMFVAAEKLHALDAFRAGLVDAISDDPVPEAMRRAANSPLAVLLQRENVVLTATRLCHPRID